MARGATKPKADSHAAVTSYEEAKRLASDKDPTVRQELAARTDIQPEVLYFLAEDESADVRREIAANEATPRQADAILARDRDDAVRISLAHKIARLAPNLSPSAQGWLQDVTIEILEQLAQDQLPRVRQIIAEEIRHLDNLPPPLVKRLAKDIELIVCSPVLEFSPLLDDEDLLEIIESKPVQGALGAISRRKGLGERVADAIVARDDAGAVAELLANPSAQIREETLDHIIDVAPEQPTWHEPLVHRDHLPSGAIQRLARFISDSLLAVLERRHKVDPGVTREVSEAVRRRLDGSETPEGGAKPEQRAAELHAAGALDEHKILAGANRGDRDFVIEALAIKCNLSADDVRGVMSSQSAKLIVALCWKAGLAMRTAYDVQRKVGRIPANQLVSARNGVDYPFSGSEMRQTLRLFAE